MKTLKGLVLLTAVLLVFMGRQPVSAYDLSSNLPIFIIDTEGTINADAKIHGTMKVIPGSDSCRSSTSSTDFDYSGDIGIKWRGNSSLSNDQKKYTVETRDSLGNDTAVSILGLPAGADWVLLAPYNDISMIRDVIACDMWNEMGHWGPRTRMCEVIENGDYRGVYVFTEQIKRGPDRVDISKLKETDTEGRDLTGGYIVRVDAYDDSDATFQSSVPGIQPSMWSGWGWGGGSSTGTVTWTVYYPKKENLQPEQMSYISQFVDNMEKSFQQSDYKDGGYAEWVDIESFVDYFIHTEISMNADGFKRSSYFYKEKDKKDGTVRKLHAGPVWDYNLAYGNCNFCNADNPESWVYEGCYTNPTPEFWTKLAQDPAFMELVKERYAWLRDDLLSLDRINSFIDQYASMLDESKERHFNKYTSLLSSGQSGQSGWGWGWGWGGGSNIWYAAYSVSSYSEEIVMLKKWFSDRFAFLDDQWGYNATLIPQSPEQGFFNVSFSVTGGNKVEIRSDRPLVQIAVRSLNGALLANYMLDGSQQYDLDVQSLHGPVVISCLAADASFISRKLLMM